MAVILENIARLKAQKPATPTAAGGPVEEQLHAQIMRCWREASRSLGPEGLPVEITLDLAPDGSLVGQPQVVDAARLSSDPHFLNAAATAVRATTSCSPYTMPLVSYSAWKRMAVTFIR